MKKQFFNPALLNSKPGHLPKITSRRFVGSNKHGSSSYKTDGGDDDPEGKKKQFLDQIKVEVAKELAERGASKEQVQSIQQFTEEFKKLPLEALREMADDKKGAMATIANYGIELQKLSDKLEANKKEEDLSTRSQVEKFITTNKETIKAIRSGQTQALNALPPFELQTRAVANPMLPSTVMPGGSLFITRLGYEQGSVAPLGIPTVWDILRKPRTSFETLVWVNKLAREGAAAFIAPGVYKPNVSFTFDTDISNAKKVAASEKMATELLEDVEGFTDYVENDLQNAVLMEANSKVTTGVLSSTSPAGIRTLSVTFAGPSLGIRTKTPNNYDAIKAVETQLLSQDRFKNRRVVTMINPIDKANMDMTKAVTQGQLFVPFTLRSILIEDSSVPVGYIQCFVVDAYQIRVYKPFRMSWGWENDDFTKNLVTTVGEMRIHQFVKDADSGFAVYDSIATIIDGIEDPQD